MSEQMKGALTFVASLLLIGIVWETVSAREIVNPLVLPSPSAIGDALWHFVTNFVGPLAYWEDTWVTLQEILLGFLLGAGGALVLGALVAEFKTVRRIVVPYTVALNATPKIAFAPLFIVWFGFGVMPKLLMAAFICFFPVLVNMVSGLESVDNDELELMASMRASRWQTFRRLKLYQALPYIFAGLRTAMAFAVVGAIIGEFAGAQNGLGFQIEFAAARLETANLFAFLIVLSLMAYVLYALIEFIERKVVFWSGAARTDRSL
jgi:NitT/TauT family transport system permease protein